MQEYLLKMEGICKAFPGVKALDEAGILVKKGEVHALMGENGAGKSTLMKILNGLLQPDKGEIWLEGEQIKIENPAAALKKGIAMIYQELNPIRDMTVAENIFIGREFVKGIFPVCAKPAATLVISASAIPISKCLSGNSVSNSLPIVEPPRSASSTTILESFLPSSTNVLP